MPLIKTLALCLALAFVTTTDGHATSARNLRVQSQSDTSIVDVNAVQTTSSHLDRVPGLIDANVDVKTIAGASATVTTTDATANSATTGQDRELAAVHDLAGVAPISGIPSPRIAPLAPAPAGGVQPVLPTWSKLNFANLMGDDQTNLHQTVPIGEPVKEAATGVVSPATETANSGIWPEPLPLFNDH